MFVTDHSSSRRPCRIAMLLPALLGLLAAASASALPPPPDAQPALQPPTERVKDCTTGGCHAKEKEFRFQHGPSAVGACDTCHAHADEQKHTFRIKQEKEALCTFCHIGGGQAQGKVVHKPFEEGECLTCHNPHGGANRALLRKDDMASLCADCHDDVTKKREHVHGPVASGSCAACHSSHRSEFPSLLVAQGRDLCLDCHDQMKNQISHVKVLHEPVKGDCQQCHETHASDHKMHLKQPAAELCISCHEPVQQQIASATFKHSVVMEKDACLNCHTSHGSDLAMLMKAEPAQTCLSCHDKKIQVSKEHIVGSVAAIADSAQNKHGPIRDGDCSGCHTPHGGQISRLLAKPYPETFYQPFDVEQYSLCFSCHDQQLVTLEKTRGLTKFRNGEQNLHYAHVNKSDKGRSCRACHSTHTSTQPMHLRETVPYGKWEMPIDFKQTSSGGSCKPGCHEGMSYDREKPIENRPPPKAPAGGSAVAKER